MPCHLALQNSTSYSSGFGASSEDELGAAIRDCLTSGVAFSMDASDLQKALQVFKCDGDVGTLSEIVKEQLLKKIGTAR